MHAARWRHQMESFSVSIALCAWNSPVTGEFLSQRPVMRSLDVAFNMCLNKRLSKQSWGWRFYMPSCSLWRHTAINHRGVRHILECLPTITHLYHSEVIPVALQLLQCGSLTLLLHLECLKIEGLDDLIYATEHTIKHPPDFSVFSNVKSVDIILKHTECEQLKVFHQIKNLFKLKIRPNTQRSQWPPSIPFDPWVSTLIEIAGGNLYELWLEGVTCISFLAIGNSCPTLRSLHIDFQSVRSKELPIGLKFFFQNVEELCLSQDISFDMIHPEIEQIILGLISPMHKIKSIELSDIKLSNTFLMSLLSSYPLNDVEMISLVGCDIKMISDDISRFIKKCAKLRELSIWYANLYDSIYLSEFGFHRKSTEELAGRVCNVALWLKMDPPNSIYDSDELPFCLRHKLGRPGLLVRGSYYSGVITTAMASQFTKVSTVCSIFCVDQRNIKAMRHWPLWGESNGDSSG